MGRAILAILALCFHAAISEPWIEKAGKLYGDVILTAEQERMLLNSTSERNAIVDMKMRWPNNVVPYVYTATFSKEEKEVINAAIADYSAKTCIKFIPRTNEADYIEFIKNGGCYSYWGRANVGKQPVSLDRGCVYKYIVIHELMHAIGFLHEQSRFDRDDYVKINWDNIQERGKSQFRKKPTSEAQLIGPYDLKSVMHYEEYDFSVQWGVKKVMEAKDGTSPLSNHDGFTDLDVQKINTLYECQNPSSTAATTPSTEPPTEEPSTEDPSTETPSDCYNVFDDKKCNWWAKQGQCTKRIYSNFMANECAKACKVCKEEDRCYDRYVFKCKFFAKRGFCDSEHEYGWWMMENCALSCGFAPCPR